MLIRAGSLKYVLVFSACVLLGAFAAQAALPGQNGRIAFAVTEKSESRIAVVNGDGAAFRILTPVDQSASEPSWSSDGLKLVFVTAASDGWHIDVMDFLTGQTHNVFTSTTAVGHPRWSPDSAKIAFDAVDAASSTTEIWTIAADGTNPVQLTVNAFNDDKPSWSPDGTKIAFSTDRDGNREIYVMAADGTAPVNVTANPASDDDPDFAPDGLKIAFSRMAVGGTSGIWLINVDGTGAVQLTDPAIDAFAPAFAPDGTKIAFLEMAEDMTDLRVMDVNGANPMTLRFDVDGGSAPAWEPINAGGVGLPVAAAGPDVRIECTSFAGGPVVLDGSASVAFGAGNHIALFEWFENFGTADEQFLGLGSPLDLTLPLGAHTITLQVTDMFGQTATDELVVTIVDTTPPVIMVRLSPSVLWPPNHRLVPVHADVEAHDICGPVTVVLDSVTSSEPDNGLGDGDTANDIQGATLGTADFDFFLRAERSGRGPGRIYVATYTATDPSGNSASAGARVTVPHDQGKRSDTGDHPGKGPKGPKGPKHGNNGRGH